MSSIWTMIVKFLTFVKLLNLRKFYTRLLRGSLHTRVQGLWGHDDLQGAPFGSVQVGLTDAQCDGVVVEMSLDFPGSPYPLQYVLRYSPWLNTMGCHYLSEELSSSASKHLTIKSANRSILSECTDAGCSVIAFRNAFNSSNSSEVRAVQRSGGI